MTETKKSNACVLEPTGYDLPANIATTNPRRYAPSRAVIVECYSDELRCRRLFALCDAIEPDCSEVRARNRSGNGPPSRYALRRDNLACIMSTRFLESTASYRASSSCVCQRSVSQPLECHRGASVPATYPWLRGSSPRRVEPLPP